MKWEEYISEIELIEKQNNDEYDLYTVDRFGCCTNRFA